ncbi:MAG TPA: dioxygenase [Gammaproteobacteria bacterium]|jgi:carotenoid cleavage dioxygenase-like enzyme|nr:dioxygenase [Gammaproteobacteria bacterium]MDA8911431.1 carotenoid oxygenase family protein [Pseudomonadales bacterium]MDC1366493.1 carotenoid oxygenase family protein [Pseudomonadales bacterium]HAF38931.1 dioxygenase [Gammaproteobacteria bacterium]HAJ30055.1 dioxygenase [Gammaproteobacteria bacterium]
MSEARQEKAPFWLRDNFAPTFEERTESDLKVIGQIPESLQGTLLRNGANPQSGESAHWFLGNGMLHGVRIEAGQAKWYRNRYVKTPLYLKPDGDVMDGLGDMTMSAANTNVIQHAGKIMALEEGHWPFVVSNELETVGPNNYGGKLEGAMTAHPKICPETGELLAFSYGMTPPYLTYLRASASGELLQTEQIEVPGATMIHDFNVTRNFVIFMDLPAVWNFEGMATTGLPILWDESYGARLGVMPRNGGNADVVWYEIDPCYVFHPLNAYENGDKIVIDVCRMDDTMKPGSSAPPMLYRWTIDQASGRVTETQLDDRVVDFPRVADAVVGLKHQFGYCAAFAGSAPYGEGLIKYDLEAGTSEYRHLDGGQASEAVFVKDPTASGEDGGFLLSYVYQPEIDQSEVLILNAQDMLGEPVARIQIPARVPAGFHGNWIGD